MEQIEDAAKKANAYNFIMSNQFEDNEANKNDNLGKGFDRRVGPKGGQVIDYLDNRFLVDKNRESLSPELS